jgi:hypothetical protein
VHVRVLLEACNGGCNPLGGFGILTGRESVNGEKDRGPYRIYSQGLEPWMPTNMCGIHQQALWPHVLSRTPDLVQIDGDQSGLSEVPLGSCLLANRAMVSTCTVNVYVWPVF